MKISKKVDFKYGGKFTPWLLFSWVLLSTVRMHYRSFDLLLAAGLFWSGFFLSSMCSDWGFNCALNLGVFHAIEKGELRIHAGKFLDVLIKQDASGKPIEVQEKE